MPLQDTQGVGVATVSASNFIAVSDKKEITPQPYSSCCNPSFTHETRQVLQSVGETASLTTVAGLQSL